MTLDRATFNIAKTSSFTSRHLSLYPSTMPSETDLKRLGAWSAILSPDAGIDRHTCTRVVPLSVINAGVSRTGTLSMTEAFRILGYAEPYHFTSIFANCRDADMWADALNAKYFGKGKPFGRKEFDQLLGHTSAVSDTPCFVMWKELTDAYPDAKVVLTQRDEEKWLVSCRALIEGTLNPVTRYGFRYLDPFWMGRILRVGLDWTEGWFGVQGNMTVETCMANARQKYREHYRDVKACVPKERLLEYELGSGWVPLCQFLGKPVPSVPFPHVNEAKMLDAAFGAFAGRALKNSLFNITVVVGVGSILAAMIWKYTGSG